MIIVRVQFSFLFLYTVFESLLLFSSDKSIKSIPSSFEFFSIHWNIYTSFIYNVSRFDTLYTKV